MDRRTFITGTAVALVPFSGCAGSSTTGDPSPPGGPIDTDTTESRTQRTLPETSGPVRPTTGAPNTQQRTGDACKGATFLAFYAAGDDFIWSPSQVAVGFNLGAGERVRLVVYEKSRILGVTEAEAPNDAGVEVDGQPIPLTTELSGEHTIRAVMYGDSGESGSFDPDTATPCQYEGEIIQTEPTTVNFSELSENTSPTPQTSSAG